MQKYAEDHYIRSLFRAYMYKSERVLNQEDPLPIGPMNVMAASVTRCILFVAIGDHISAYNTKDCGIVGDLRRSIRVHEGSLISQIKLAKVSEEYDMLIVAHAHGVSFFDHMLNPIHCPYMPDESSWGISFYRYSDKEIRILTTNNGRQLVAFYFNPVEKSFFEFSVEYNIHRHNIPCVSISPCGQYYATCSIDGTFAIWQAHPEFKVVWRSDIGNEWLWSINWVRKSSIIDLSTPLYNIPANSLHTHYNHFDSLLLLTGDKSIMVYWFDEDMVGECAETLRRYHHMLSNIGMERISLVEVIEPLGICLAASQNGSSAIIYLISKCHENTKSYQIHEIDNLSYDAMLDHNPQTFISGMCVTERPACNAYDVKVLLRNTVIVPYTITYSP